MKKIIDLKKELAEIERQLSEVHAGSVMSSDKGDGVHAGQKKPVFDKKGSALVETGEEVKECGTSDGMTPGIMETEEGISDEMGGEEKEEVVILEPEEVTEKIMDLEAEVAEIKEKVEEVAEEEKEEHGEGGSEEGVEGVEGEGSIEENAGLNESVKKDNKVLTEELARMKKLSGI